MKEELAKWDPVNEFNEIQKRLSSLFLHGNGKGELTNLTGGADWAPAVDVSEDDDEYTITADLPDVKKDDVDVRVEEGLLTISGERSHEAEKKDKKKKFHRIERSFGKYVRSFRIPDDVDSGKVDAGFKNGVLTVHLPKSEEKKPKARAIKVS